MDLDAEFQAALAAHRAGRLAEAERGYRAIVARAEHPPSLNNLGLICDGADSREQAGGFYRRAVAAAPDEPRRHFALAVHLRETRRLAEAEAAYRRVLSLDPAYPDAEFDLGCVLIAMGRFAEGWSLYEARAARAKMIRRGPSFPEWRGEPLAGKRLLVWREQGFGDQIMMARFLAMLPAAEVTYAGSEPLRRLFGPLPVRFAEDDAAHLADGRHDYWTLPCSLPHRLGVSAETLPTAPYLSGAAGPANGGVGVMWRGAPNNRNDRFRSLPADLAQRLLSLPGAVSLDPAESGAADFQATADLISGLSLVISVDTAVAHLAGAMGRPVWVLLAQHALDWQWPREGHPTWYPSARLWIQPTAGDWAHLVETVRREATVTLSKS